MDSPCILSAQHRAIGTLPLVNNGTIVIDDDNNLNHTPDYDRVEKIYNDLVNTRGDFRYPVPTLFLKDQEGFAAYIDYNHNHIVLEKKAFDTCLPYGDAAIAFLLGHELTHYYEKHAWRSSYARDNSDLTIGKTLKDIVDGVANETEADYLGGFLAYAAGYGMFDKADSIIQSLYTAYTLEDNMAGYPSVQDRIKLSQRSFEKMSMLVDVFTVGNYFAAAGQFELAYLSYAYVLNYYQSRELYNNLGVFSTINAMALFHPDSLKYRYVTELDINFRGSRNIDAPIQQQINAVLDQAILHFNSAINLDPSYAPAYLNKANALALKKEWQKAKFYLVQEAKPIALAQSDIYSKTLIDIDILEAIIEANLGNTLKARTLLDMHSQTSMLAEINLKALNGEKVNKSLAKMNKNSTDAIDSMTINTFFELREFDPSRVMELKEDIVLFQNKKSPREVDIFFLDDMSNKNKKMRYVFMSTREGYLGHTNKGIQLNDTADSVINSYGEPLSSNETTDGQLLVYDDIIFVIRQGKVMKWILRGVQRFR